MSETAMIKTHVTLSKETPTILQPVIRDDEIDWWSKFYASIGESDKKANAAYLDTGMDLIKVIYSLYIDVFDKCLKLISPSKFLWKILREKVYITMHF